MYTYRRRSTASLLIATVVVADISLGTGCSFRRSLLRSLK